MTDNGAVLTADLRVLDVINHWCFDIISNDTTGAVVDGGSGFDYSYCWNTDKATFTLQMDGREAFKKYSPANGDISVESGKVDSTPETTEAPSGNTTEPTENKPADPEDKGGVETWVIVVVAAVVVAAVVAGVAIFRKKK